MILLKYAKTTNILNYFECCLHKVGKVDFICLMWLKDFEICLLFILRDGPLEKWWWGGWGQSQKTFSQEIINKKTHSYGCWPKKICPRRICVVRLLQINYEVNDKSRLEIKSDFFKSQHDSWVNIVKDYLDLYSRRSGIEIEEFNILHDDVLFTNLCWPNN